MLDLKGNDARLPSAVLDAVAASGTTREIAVCSQNWRLLEGIDGRRPVTVIQSIGKARRLRAVLGGRMVPDAGAISIHERFLDQGTVGVLRKSARTIVTWPVNDVARMRALVDLGIDGMITDEIAVVREIVSMRGGVPQ